jgi:hypothetical protein
MARPRTPKQRPEATGAAKRNPGGGFRRALEPAHRRARERVRVAVCGPGPRVGPVRTEFPWLQESDRALVEIATVIRARLIAGEDVGMTALNHLRLCCAMMAARRLTERSYDCPRAGPLAHYFNFN